MKIHFGIDYGSKLAGTTAICFNKDEELVILNSKKKKDSDQFIADAIEELGPTKIYLDAPLSLPAAFFGKGANFHFRTCDVLTSAMSPMFLGGLTARAMKLKHAHSTVDFYECYPGYYIRKVLEASEHYNKKEKIPNTQILSLIQKQMSHKLPIIESYHQLDAIICWLSGLRHIKNQHLVLGDENEGVIIV